MIHVANLSKTVSGVTTLKKINLHVSRGEMVAFIGASNSGKSVLLRQLCGLASGDMDGGQVAVGGRVIQKDGVVNRDIRDIRARIGMLFQPSGLAGRISVARNVALGALTRTSSLCGQSGCLDDADVALAMKALERMGIRDKAWQRTSSLSGGQQRRAAIARTLAQRAELLLADQSVDDLDPESFRSVMEILREFNAFEGLTIMVALSRAEYAVPYCPRTVALYRGEIVFDGPSSSLTPALLDHIYGDGRVAA